MLQFCSPKMRVCHLSAFTQRLPLVRPKKKLYISCNPTDHNQTPPTLRLFFHFWENNQKKVALYAQTFCEKYSQKSKLSSSDEVFGFQKKVVKKRSSIPTYPKKFFWHITYNFFWPKYLKKKTHTEILWYICKINRKSKIRLLLSFTKCFKKKP